MNSSFLEEIHYFRLPVIDLEVSVQWYTACLGLTLRRQADDLAVMELPTGPLLILVAADSESRGHFIRGGLPEFAVGFTCREIHKFRDYLIEQNVKAEEMQEENGHFHFHFFDPSGNKLQAHW